MANVSDNWVYETCYRCKEGFAISRELYNVLRRSHGNFHCPHGHPQHYVEGKTETEKLREERDRLAQRIAEKDDEIAAERRRTDYQRERKEHERRRVSAAKGQVTRLKNRAAAGVCPCCSRHFENLERHMASKHADFTAKPQDADNVVKLKTA